MSTDVRAFVAQAAGVLGRAGVASPSHDAEALLAFVLGTTRAELYARRPGLLPRERAAAEALVTRRAAREPLQHLTGVAGFRHLDVAVGPGVFVPRPETEILTGEAIDELARLVEAGVEHPVAVDLCTGSGADAAALATEVPQCKVTADDVSDAAHAYAVRNAGPFGVDVRLGDMSEAVEDLVARHRACGHRQPAVHPSRGLRLGRSRGT